MIKTVKIIGGGLAGCECAYQLAKRGVNVKLYEMKPKFTQAHKNENLAELVCSNSLKSNEITTAGGLLKQELRELDSLLISVADQVRVPAGASLSVDRDKFSAKITEIISSMDNVEIIREEVTKYLVEGDLRREVGLNIKNKMEIGSYQGIRHRKGLPVRGQRTNRNARTRKGKGKTVANKKK